MRSAVRVRPARGSGPRPPYDEPSRPSACPDPATSLRPGEPHPPTHPAPPSHPGPTQPPSHPADLGLVGVDRDTNETKIDVDEWRGACLDGDDSPARRGDHACGPGCAVHFTEAPPNRDHGGPML